MITIRYTGPASAEALLSLMRRATEDDPVVVALDGFAASGKTTFSHWLEENMGARVVHTDDFYLPAALRSPERYAQPGGTIHYERLKEEVIDCLDAPVLRYGVFERGIMDVGHTRTLPFSPVTVIEGAYACHPYFGSYAAARCFMETTPEKQRERIRARNGEEGLAMFEARWIPYELAYEAAFRIREGADFHLLS